MAITHSWLSPFFVKNGGCPRFLRRTVAVPLGGNVGRGIVCALIALGLSSTALAQQVTDIKTVPEKTGFRETSKYADVVAFLDAVAKASPRVHLTTFGTTNEQRALPLAVIGAAAATPQAVRQSGKLRVYIQANIHAGEVEGKESAQ